MTAWVASTVGAVLLVVMQVTGHGQVAGIPSELRTQLRERYDIVALQRGVALVPREAGAVRMIQIVDGVVTIDGETLTGAQLRNRIGRDADLVLQVSYLDAQRQRELAGPSADAAPAAPSPTPAPNVVERTQITRGDRVRFGESLRIDRNERVEGDVAVFGGSADVDGEVTGDIAVFGGPLRLGPDAVVRGDVSVMGGSLDRASGAQIFGSVNEMTGGPWRFGRGWQWANVFGTFWSRLWGLAGTAIRITFLVLLGIAAVAILRDPVERIAARAGANPMRSGLIGLLAQILFVPVLVLTVVVLAVSIIGIPLLALVPFAVLLLLLVMVIGFLGLAYHVGRLLTDRLGWTERGAYAAMALGVVAVGALTLAAKAAALAGGFLIGGPLTALGYLVEYVAWTVGFGAAILAWYETQTRFGARRQPPGAMPPVEA